MGTKFSLINLKAVSIHTMKRESSETECYKGGLGPDNASLRISWVLSVRRLKDSSDF